MGGDADDTTPAAIKGPGAEIVSYGAPVPPGAMFLLAYYGEKRLPIIGLPGCVMYAKRTVFDLVLPRLMADDPVTAQDIAQYLSAGNGGVVNSSRGVLLAYKKQPGVPFAEAAYNECVKMKEAIAHACAEL